MPSLDNCFTKLNQIITHENISDTDSLGKLSEAINEFSQAITKESSLGFQDIYLLFDENILELIKQKKDLSSAQKTLLTAWVELAGKYINDPENDDLGRALLLNLENQQWPLPLRYEDTSIIAGMMGIKLKDNDEVVAEETDALSMDSVNSLKLAIENYKTESSLENIITYLGKIASDAAESNLLGFEDVCMLLQQNLEDLACNKKKLSDEQCHSLQQWANDANSYVNDQNNDAAALSLINALTASYWPSSLTEIDIPMIKDMFCLVDEPDQIKDSSPSDIVDGKSKYSITENNVTASAEAYPVSPMLIDMLLDEIRKIEKDINEAKTKIISESIDEKLRSDALMQLSTRLERFGNACQAAELAGLYQTSGIMRENIALLNENEGIASQELGDLIGKWPKSVEGYLLSLGDNSGSENLVNTLNSKALYKPLIPEVVPALIDLLNAPYPSEEETKETRQTEATPEDVSLKLPTDISQELLDGLLQELPSQTEGLSNAIHALIDGSGGNKESENAQRIAHTVKGAANTVGIRGIASLTHQIEDIFLLLNKHQKLPSRALAYSLIVAADCLEEMSESLTSQEEVPANSLKVFQSILDWNNRLENEGIKILDDDATSVSENTASKKDIEEKPENDTEDEQVTIATLRVQAPIIDDLIRLLGETIILTTQLQEKIKNSTDETEELVNLNETTHELVNQLEQQVELRTIANVPQAVNQNEIFDALELEQYSELNTVTNQLAESTLDSVELNRHIKHDLHELDELLVDQSRLHREAQRLVMRTRMVPIKTIAPRLQRNVRQTCRLIGKQATLHLAGTDTLIDSDILNNLVDPLIHILRNSLDHGIEDRNERINKNKDPEGKIDLSFSSEGTQIVVRCKDDGAGLDHDAIRVTAIKRGLIEPEEKPTPIELDRMILKPGFSTSKKTTQISGRGIGMDLVYSQILASKGAIHIESKRDEGLQIELRMPVTLISSHVLIIRHRNKILAVSSRGVEQILHPSDSEIIESYDGFMCKVDNELIELSNLEDLIDFSGDQRLKDRETRPALLIREEDINKVVYLQEIVDSRELVIKSMGKHMNNIHGIPGAIILGDGSVAPVLDIPDLLRSSTRREERTEHDDLEHTSINAILPTVLIVDDSLSARRALAQVVKDAGYDIRTAKDGVEAVEITEKKVPNILLVDMEMPRMNGMELTAYIRANPETADIPVIMVTSRSTEKHREQASSAGVNVHLTKPFSEDDLLDHISKLLN